MNLDVELQGLVRENEGDLMSFARKLYEHGYRQGLASRPQSPSETTPASPPIAPPPIPPQGPLFPSRPMVVESHDDEDEDSEEREASSKAETTTCDHRVRGSITIAGLQRKIERLFDLSRFDIEVVICRRGDPERRRLKSSVKLKNYLLDSE